MSCAPGAIDAERRPPQHHSSFAEAEQVGEVGRAVRELLDGERALQVDASSVGAAGGTPRARPRPGPRPVAPALLERVGLAAGVGVHSGGPPEGWLGSQRSAASASRAVLSESERCRR